MSSVYDKQTASSPVKFPAAPYPGPASFLDAYAEEIARACKTIDPEAFSCAADTPARRASPTTEGSYGSAGSWQQRSPLL